MNCRNCNEPIIRRHGEDKHRFLKRSFCSLAPPNKTAYLTRDGFRVEEGDHGFSESEVMRRIGKKAAGHLLDGKVWQQFPEVAR